MALAPAGAAFYGLNPGHFEFPERRIGADSTGAGKTAAGFLATLWYNFNDWRHRCDSRFSAGSTSPETLSLRSDRDRRSLGECSAFSVLCHRSESITFRRDLRRHVSLRSDL